MSNKVKSKECFDIESLESSDVELDPTKFVYSTKEIKQSKGKGVFIVKAAYLD